MKRGYAVTMLSVCFLLLAAAVQAAVIPINGYLTTNMTWTKDNIYQVMSNTTLVGGTTLTVEPGTRIELDAGVVLEIKGKLVAQGTAQEKIIFTSSLSTPAIGDWDKIIFLNVTSEDNSHESLIEHVVVEYSSQGLYQASTTFNIQNSTFRYNGYGLILSSTAGVSIIRDNHFAHNAFSGIGLFGSAASPPLAQINNNHFYGQLNYNIYAIPTGAPNDMSAITVNADGNWWGSNDPTEVADKIWDNSDQTDSLVVNITNARLDGYARSGAISGNATWTTAMGTVIVTADLEVESAATLTIEPGVRVEVLNNGLGDQFTILNSGTLNVNGQAGQEVLFTSRSFDQALAAAGDWQALQLNPSSVANLNHFRLEYATLGLLADGVTANLNEATLNDNVIGLLLRNGASPQVTNSRIQDNTQIGVLISGSQAQPSAPVFHDNDIINNGLYAFQLETTAGELSGLTIDAENNWWGTLDAAAIDAAIFDNEEDGLLAEVDFRPYLDASGGQPTGNGPTMVTSDVISDTVWKKSDAPFIIKDHINVAAGVTLTIEPGVEVLFDGFYGVVVDGRVLALGTQAQPIRWASNSATPDTNDWKELRFSAQSNAENNQLQHVIIEHAAYGVNVSTIAFEITDTVFQNNSLGLQITTPYTGLLTGNTFQNNSIGLELHGLYVNTFPQPQITRNHFLNNTHSILISRGPASMTVDANDNWWGTTNRGEIGTYIRDLHDDYNLAEVDVSTALDGPNGASVPMPTYLSQSVTEDTTWTKAQSPYVIGRGITVYEGVTLTIEPGVEVYVWGYEMIHVAGALMAVGTVDEPIVFGTYRPVASDQDWSGIRFHAVSATSRLEHVQVRHARNGLYVDSPHVELSQLLIEECETGLMIYDGGQIQLSQSVFQNNPLAIRINDLDHQVQISGNQFLNNQVNLSGYYSNPGKVVNFEGNWFGSTDPEVIEASIHHQGDGSSVVLIDYTPYLDGPNGQLVGADGSVPHIIDTDTYWDAQMGPIKLDHPVHVMSGVTLTLEDGLHVLGDPQGQLIVDGQLISQGDKEWNVIFASAAQSAQKGDWPGIVLNNGSSVMDHITIREAQVGLRLANGVPFQTNNMTFEHNQTGVWVADQASLTLVENVLRGNDVAVYAECSLASNCQLTMMKNSFVNNTTSIATTALGSDASTHTIQAQNNWWGTTTLTDIDQMITDQNDQATLARVIYQPILDSPGGSGIGGGIVGDLITTDTLWTLAGSPYVVASELSINDGITLTIEPGVQVLVEKDLQIRVGGKIISQGTNSTPIRFSSALEFPKKDSWFRIYMLPSASNQGSIFEYTHFEDMRLGLVTERTSKPLLQNNTFRHNEIGLDLSSSMGDVTGNHFVDNDFGLVMRLGTGVQSTFGVHHNRFENNITSVITNNTASEEVIYDFSHNWWGSTNPREIQAKIVDAVTARYDWSGKMMLYASSRPQVTFTPFLDQNDQPIGDHYLYGRIVGNEVWGATIQNYEIIEDIYVLPDADLTILPDTRLTFHGDYYLYADGALHAVGTESQPIIWQHAGPNYDGTADWQYILLSQGTMAYNHIRHAKYGLLVEAGSPELHHNRLEQNEIGLAIHSEGSPNVHHNQIIGNETGIWVDLASASSNTTRVNYNHIQSNLNYAVEALPSFQGTDNSGFILDFENNYWGTTDEAVIEQSIYDIHEHAKLPLIDFEPFLNQVPDEDVRISDVSMTPQFFDPASGESTVIAYELDAAADVSIIVYDPLRFNTLGEVMPLTTQAAGSHQWSWDGSLNGQPLSDGAYALKIIAQSSTQHNVYDPIEAVSEVSMSAISFSPNTFRPAFGETVQLDFQIPEASFVQMMAGGVNNDLRRTFFSYDPLPAGSHSVTWDGRDDQGVLAVNADYQIAGRALRMADNIVVIVSQSLPVNSNLILDANLYAFYPSLGEVVTIDYSMDQAQQAQIVVLDSNGQQQRVLLDQPLAAGPGQVVWDGRDDQGRIITTPGDYRVEMRVGGEQTSLLIRIRD